MSTNSQILFLSHGGGPLPLLNDPAHQEMVECLQGIAVKIGRPSAILVISAHWEEEKPTITGGANPSLIYDYYGFPQESYNIECPCKGDPLLARTIQSQLEQSRIGADLDMQRGFDHGLFVPLKLMYPDADIPCVQLSLLKNLDPAQHLRVGEALQAIDYDDLLVIGSGFSFHNLKAFFSANSSEATSLNNAFESWLLETCTSSVMSEQERKTRLVEWECAPGARFCHPREEHLLPLHVCYCLANRPCSESFQLNVLNKRASMYLWQQACSYTVGCNDLNV